MVTIWQMCSEINVREMFQNHTNPSGVLHMSAIKHFVGHLVSTFSPPQKRRTSDQLFSSCVLPRLWCLLYSPGGGGGTTATWIRFTSYRKPWRLGWQALNQLISFCLPLASFPRSSSFLSASLYFSKRGAYWDRLCRDVVGRWLSRACTWPNGAS